MYGVFYKMCLIASFVNQMDRNHIILPIYEVLFDKSA